MKLHVVNWTVPAPWQTYLYCKGPQNRSHLGLRGADRRTLEFVHCGSWVLTLAHQPQSDKCRVNCQPSRKPFLKLWEWHWWLQHTDGRFFLLSQYNLFLYFPWHLEKVGRLQNDWKVRHVYHASVNLRHGNCPVDVFMGPQRIRRHKNPDWHWRIESWKNNGSSFRIWLNHKKVDTTCFRKEGNMT